jgi:hypothetical protein
MLTGRPSISGSARFSRASAAALPQVEFQRIQLARSFRVMAYHLYDNNRRHLAMSDSFSDLESAAADVCTQDGRPFCFIRWTEAGGQQKEIRVSPETLAVRASQTVTDMRQVRLRRRSDAHREAHRRAALVTNAMVGFLLLYIVGEITSILMQAPFPAVITGP